MLITGLLYQVQAIQKPLVNGHINVTGVERPVSLASVRSCRAEFSATPSDTAEGVEQSNSVLDYNSIVLRSVSHVLQQRSHHVQGCCITLPGPHS